ncbi:unnamed protein product, partial [Darwinula stevensoni]
MVATLAVVTYYVSIMATCVFYFIKCFNKELPWAECSNETLSANLTCSENYYVNEVLKQYNSTQGVDEGLGAPEWRLTLCLLFSWAMIVFSLIRGVQSSGRISYFTALFPYVVLVTLLILGATLEGAVDGIKYFITPQWEKLAEGKVSQLDFCSLLFFPVENRSRASVSFQVWFAAVSQCFFSLSVGFGSISMYASYNPFTHNVYRDAMIISVMDTFTSLLAGFSIFSILGNLAHTSDKKIEDVVKAGTGLAFISYPDAIAKLDAVPQLFAAIFFLMLWTLGVGSAVALIGCVITVICDRFPSWDRRIVTVALCIFSFLIGLTYVTPASITNAASKLNFNIVAGPYVLGLVDYFSGGFVIFVLALLEVVSI